MKQLYILIFLSSLLTACQDDFLRVELDDEIITEDAIVDQSTAEAAAIGLYHNFQGAVLYGGDFVVAPDLLGGNAIATGFQPFYEELAVARVSAGNTYVEDVWIDLYNIVNSANNILNSIDAIDGISEEDRNRINGTAYYFRASAFFDLLRQFGYFFDTGSPYGVPIFVEVLDRTSAAEVGRATVADSYGRIITDLQQAEVLLPSSGDPGLVSQAAAKALLARVCLYQKNYAAAVDYATQVIDNPAFELNDNYVDNFRQEGSDEMIFELEFIEQDGNNLSELLMLSSANEVSASDELYEAFEEEDTRRELLLRRFGVYRCTKYGELATDLQTNVPVLRLGELYLIRSEALAFMEGVESALSDLNIIRDRAVPGTVISGVTDLDTYQEELLAERRRELYFEGHYWFDLVRLGRAEEARGIESYRRVLPIPLREVQVSGGVIEQNPEY